MKKTCSKCQIEKDEKEFAWRSISEKRKHSHCKDCKTKVDNKYYASSNERRRKIRKRALSYYQYLNEYVKRLKRFGKCSKCEDCRWYVLDFHHLKSKKYDIPKISRNGSMRLLKEEIRKCVLLCANCHRELHYKERVSRLSR
jgi:hypothetical protein